MKPVLTLMTLILLSLVLAACGGGGQDTDDTFAAERAKAVTALENELEYVDRTLERMKRRLEQSAYASEQELHQAYHELEATEAQLEQAISGLREVDATSWQRQHRAVVESVDEFSSRVDRVWERLST